MKTLIIIPTYNEAKNIGELIAAINKINNLNLSILVVDDNSPDQTGVIVEKLKNNFSNLFLLKRSAKAGLGSAYLAGFAWALEHGFDAGVQMDADFSHDPKYLPELIAALKSYDLVIGSRYINGGNIANWPLWRKLISRGGGLYAKIILHSQINDLTGGFNAWQIDLLKKIKLPTIKSNGYCFQIEMKYRASQTTARIKELPITFTDRQRGKTKMSKKIFLEAVWRVPLLRFKKKK